MAVDERSYPPIISSKAHHPGLLLPKDKGKLDNLWTPDNASGTQSFTDFNAVAKTGHYNAFGPANSPSSVGGGDGVWYMLIHTEHTGLNGYRWQLAFNFVGLNPTIYSRNDSGGTWSAWRVINEDSGWIALTPYYVNGFADWAGWPVSFRRKNGVVRWRGLITSATTQAAGTTIANLPAGYGTVNALLSDNVSSAGQPVLYLGGQTLQAYSGLTANNWISTANLAYMVD